MNNTRADILKRAVANSAGYAELSTQRQKTQAARLHADGYGYWNRDAYPERFQLFDRVRRTMLRQAEPLTDNLPEPMKAHDVRHIRQCSHCGGIGDDRLMIHEDDDRIHTKCYLKRSGFTAALKLTRSERDKFRVCDLTIPQMRRLLRAA